MLAIIGEGIGQNINTEQNGETEATRLRTGPSIGLPVFTCNANDKYTELKNFRIQVINIFLTKHYDKNETEYS